jgi:hypothetical protein
LSLHLLTEDVSTSTASRSAESTGFPETSRAAELLAFGTAESATDIVELWRRRIKTELDPADLDCRWDEIWESLPEDLHLNVSHGWNHPQEGGSSQSLISADSIANTSASDLR